MSPRLPQTFPPLILAHNITVRRGKSPLFTKLHFCVRQNGHLALMGKNGVGKSSLLEVLGGYLRPFDLQDSYLRWEFEEKNKTSPLVARRHIRLFSPHQQARYVQQDWQVCGREIVLSGFLNEALVYGTATTKQIEEVEKLGAEAGVSVLLDKPLSALSQGQLRMLLLLRTFVATPRLLLLDEPYDGLSETWRVTLTQLLHKMALQGATIVLTAHRLSDVPPFITQGIELVAKKDAFPSGLSFKQNVLAYTSADFHSAEHMFHLFMRENISAERNTNSLVHEQSQKYLAEHSKPTQGSLRSKFTRTVLFDKRSLCKRYHDFAPSPYIATDISCFNAGISPNISSGNISFDKNSSATKIIKKACNTGVGAKTENALMQKDVPLLSMQGVDVYVERNHVLKDMHWEIKQGENWIVKGANGAGKSTLLRLLYGEEVAAYGGQILWCGRERLPLPLWRTHVGLVSDKLQYLYRYDISACEVVLSGRGGAIGLYDEPAEQEYARAMQLLAFFRLESIAHISHFALSSGLMRRVLLARAMMCSPALIFLDEPCSALDAQSRLDFLASLEDLVGEGVQFVYVSHNAHDIPACFSHELVLEEGKVTFAGQRKNLGNERTFF